MLPILLGLLAEGVHFFWLLIGTLCIGTVVWFAFQLFERRLRR